MTGIRKATNSDCFAPAAFFSRRGNVLSRVALVAAEERYRRAGPGDHEADMAVSRCPARVGEGGVAANRDRAWLRGLKDMKLLLLVPEEGAGAWMVGAHVPTRDKAVVDEGGAPIDFVATINLEPWAQTLK
jgi:hypothetical protein